VTDPDGGTGVPVTDLPPEADTAAAAVRFLLAELIRLGRLPVEAADEVARQVRARERLGSTAIGRGVAVPSARTGLVAGPVGVVGRCPRPLDWPGAADGGPVRVVCLLVVPVGPAGLWLRELDRIVRQLRGGQPPGE
jgi:mannitol/fructose-specific phosphotransferase system IIA component (Ntr-type)